MSIASGYRDRSRTDISTQTQELEQMNEKVEKSGTPKRKLQKAVESRDPTILKYALRDAVQQPSVKNEQLIEARNLMMFLDPARRCTALENAIEQEDIEMIEEALLDMKEARIDDDELFDTAVSELRRLRKIRHEDKRRRRENRAEAKHKRSLEKLNSSLKKAVQSRDLKRLEKAVDNLDNSDFNGEEIPNSARAREVLTELRIERMRERLNEGIETSDAQLLYAALMDVKCGGQVNLIMLLEKYHPD